MRLPGASCITSATRRIQPTKIQICPAYRRQVLKQALSQASLEAERRAQWEHFYTELHKAPVPRTYRDTYAAGVEVRDTAGRWSGIDAWSAHEREAVVLGVRARVVGVWASSDLTILEIDFTNPAPAPDHCPPRSTFVHHLAGGRPERLDIHYV